MTVRRAPRSPDACRHRPPAARRRAACPPVRSRSAGRARAGPCGRRVRAAVGVLTRIGVRQPVGGRAGLTAEAGVTGALGGAARLAYRARTRGGHLDPRGDRGAGGGLGGRRRARGRSGARSTPARTASCSRPQVDAVLAEAGAAPGVTWPRSSPGSAPGPFTGLRVGLVTAADHGSGARRPHVRRLLAGRASATRRRPASRSWSPPTPGARRSTGPSTTAPASGSPGRTCPRRRSPPRAPATWASTVAVGDGAHRYADVLGLPCGSSRATRTPTVLAALAAERIRAGAPSEPLTPLYLRRPDAVAATGRKPVLP